jgi:hypothetical protein
MQAGQLFFPEKQEIKQGKIGIEKILQTLQRTYHA